MSEGKLSFAQAAWVIARRDFVAVLFSRAFLFFLIGPLFPIVVGAMAGGVTHHVTTTIESKHIGIAMEGADADAMIAAHRRLSARLGPALPDMLLLKRLAPGERFDPRAALRNESTGLGAVLTGTRGAPVLTGAKDRIAAWRGSVALVAAQAVAPHAEDWPHVALQRARNTAADRETSRMVTAQAAQTLLFLLIVLLAGMVLSNLVEEKTNKIIEVMAAAVPMDAVFCGKLFAMLAVSVVGLAVWGLTGGVFALVAGHALPSLPAPAVGWPLFLALGAIYFAMGYLLLGSIFLSIGSMASTVREVQTLSMPVTMMQLLVFFFASYAMAQQGSTMELLAIAFPPSSPYAMLARAATNSGLLPHLLAIAWQALAVALFVKGGAALFRKRVMKSGPARQGWFRRRRRTA